MIPSFLTSFALAFSSMVVGVVTVVVSVELLDPLDDEEDEEPLLLEFFVNITVHVLSLFIVILGLVQSPPQEVKDEPDDGVAVKVTTLSLS